MPDLQKELKQRFPKTEVRFQFCHPDEVYRAVEQGSVDFGLVSYPQQSKAIAAVHWRDEPMVLVAPAGHPLTVRERVTPEDLGLESLIAFAPNLRIRHEIDRYLRSIGITMPIAAEFDNVDSVKHALELNGAVAFLPRPAIVEELESGTLVALTCDWLNLQRPLGVIQRRDTSLGRTARALYELLFQKVAQGCATSAVSDKPSLSGAADNQALVGEHAQLSEQALVREQLEVVDLRSVADGAAITSVNYAHDHPAAPNGVSERSATPVRNRLHSARPARRPSKVSRKR